MVKFERSRSFLRGLYFIGCVGMQNLGKRIIVKFHVFLFISYTAGYKDCLAVIESLWKKSYQEKKTGLRKNKYILFRMD